MRENGMCIQLDGDCAPRAQDCQYPNEEEVDEMHQHAWADDAPSWQTD